MYPVLFEAYGLKLHSYGAMLAVGFLVALWMARRRSVAHGLQPDQLVDAGFWAILPGVVGARLGFVVQDLPRYWADPRLIFREGFQGLTSFGGVAAGALGLWLWSRRAKVRYLDLLDTAAVPFLVAYAIGRVGCLLNGCCHGGVCGLPWGVPVPNLGGLYHPAQIYEALMNVVAAIGVVRVEKTRALHVGQSVGLALGLHGAARFIYEFWRAGSSSTTIGSLPFTEGHVAAVLVAAIGVVLYRTGRTRPVVAEAPVV